MKSPIINTFIRDGSWARFNDVANALSAAVATHFGEGRTGGVATLYEKHDLVSFFTQTEIGTPDPQKLGKYFCLSLEKPARAVRLGEVCSWNADRDPALEQYGGAIKIAHLPLFVSFSGWKEQDDIVFVGYMLRRSEIIHEVDVDHIFRQHNGISLDLMVRYEEYVDALEAVPA